MFNYFEFISYILNSFPSWNAKINFMCFFGGLLIVLWEKAGV